MNEKIQNSSVRGEKADLNCTGNVGTDARHSVQSKNVFADTFELVYKVQVEEKEEENLLCKISKMEGIHRVNILSPKTKVVVRRAL